MRLVKLARLLLQEMWSSKPLERRPEPTQLMDDLRQIEAFHEQGSSALVPIYHFNALAAHRMTPAGGTVVDLGSGSGQYLAYLAERRPDLRIIGIELAPKMVEVGRRHLERRGLAGRVDLRVGDMTAFAAGIDEDVALVSSVFSLHHLPTDHDLTACLNQIREVRARTGCAVWIFDHVRPRHPGTPKLFTDLFTPSAPSAFNEDSQNSLRAAFAFDDLVDLLSTAGLDESEHRLSRWLKTYQLHWLPGKRYPRGLAHWSDDLLSAAAKRDLAGLNLLFPPGPVPP